MTTITVDRGVTVTMADGTALAADVFRPAGPGRHPVVLLRTPYDRGNAAAFGLQLNALRLVHAGYVVVTQDVRGRFDSGGAFEPFVHEGADGVTTIEWAASQPWSSGAVALAGMSYCGYVQALAARERPPALRAWIPAFCPLDVRDDWVYQGDALRLAFDLSLLIGTLAPGDRRIPDTGPVRAAFADWSDTLMGSIDEPASIAGTALGATWRSWLERAADRAWWDTLSGRGSGAHDAPSLVVGGWFDLFAHGTFALHAELAAGPGPTSLLVGPWDHAPLPLRSGSGEVDFGPSAAADLPDLELRWLDHVLRDGAAPLPQPVRVFLTGANTWLDLPAWPPSAESQAWSLRPDGCLSRDTPGAAVTVSFQTDASDPTPTLGGRLFSRPTTYRAGPVDQRPRQARPDVVSFDTAITDREVVLMGPVRGTIDSTSDHPAADIVLTLSDVDRSGRSIWLADGVRRLHGLTHDTAARFEVDLGHLAHVLRPGHRLRLDVAGGSFPEIDRQPPTGSARRTIVTGGEHGSQIYLPVVDGS